MPAPDLATLFHPMPLVNLAFKNVIETAFTEVKAVVQRGTGDLPKECVVIQSSLGAALERLHPHTDGVFYRDAWAFTISFQIYEVRDPGAGDVQALVVQKVRSVISSCWRNNAFLDYHSIVRLADQSVQDSVTMSDDSDLTLPHYTGLISIKPSAWPT